jgi:lysozyme
MTLDARRQLVESLIQHEGLRLKPYFDTVGKITIGYGRNLTDNGLTSQEAAILLDHDIDAALRNATQFDWFAGLDDERQRVVVEMIFNMGLVGFGSFRHLIHALAVKNYPEAARQMRDSRWATQTKGRAVTLAKLMEDGA